MDIKLYMDEIGVKAKAASKKLANTPSELKNKALSKVAEAIVKNTDIILRANVIDMKEAKEKGVSGALLDRLLLNEKRIHSMAEEVNKLSGLDDPVGQVRKMWVNAEGLKIGKISVPLGVIGIIYEARPNVTLEAAALCIKSGNAVILRCGSEAINSSKAITDIMNGALKSVNFPDGAVQIVETTSREAVSYLMKMNNYLNVLIPRGGAGLIRNVIENSTVPVIETGTGNCHIYLDESADYAMAESIVINAKTQRPGVCNAAEKLLINRNFAEKHLNEIISALKNKGVEVRGCEETIKMADVKPADENDWGTEYLDLIMAVKIVENIDEAIDHIGKYSTGHSEAIITESYNMAMKFLKEVDSAAVYVNASTRFTDGGQFGFGGEMGISTQKLHVRGPMGANELTSYKYIIFGDGQIRK